MTTDTASAVWAVKREAVWERDGEAPLVEAAEALFAGAWPTRTAVRKAVRRGELWVGGRVRKAHTGVRKGDVVQWRRRAAAATPLEADAVPEGLALRVLVDTDDYAVVVKPTGVPTVAGSGWHCERLLAHALRQAEVESALHRPRVVHRLDKEVGGCVVAAKSHSALLSLSSAFSERRVSKKYVALVAGEIPLGPGVCTAPLRDRKTGQDQPCETRYVATAHTPSARHGTVTTVELEPKTGRYHQLRRHLSEVLKTPILGDHTYGGRSQSRQADAAWRERGAGGLMLWSNEVRVSEPLGLGSEEIRAEAPLPERFAERLRLEAEDSTRQPHVAQGVVGADRPGRVNARGGGT